MARRSLFHVLLFVTLLAPLGAPVPSSAAPAAVPSTGSSGTPAARSPQQADRAAFALTFMSNQGQLDPAIAFQAQALGGALDFTASGITFTLPPAAPPESPRTRMLRRRPRLLPQTLTLRYRDANAAPIIAALGDAVGTVSVQVGDPSTWRSDLPTYTGIGYQQLYAGIDLAYTSSDGRLKSTYTVAPGADPAVIGWQYDGADAPTVDAATGDLLITLPAQIDGTTALTPTTLVEHAPLAWQEITGQQVAVAARYAVDADGTVGFALGAYDATRPLVIDPEVTYQTRGIPAWGYGGAVATGADGTSYVVTSPIRPGSYGDLYVMAFAPDAEVPTEAHYFGGDDFDIASAITVGADGALYIVGDTRSANFAPSTANRLQHFVGAADPYYPDFVREDAFLIRLDPATLEPTYGTFLGGTQEDSATGVAVRADGTVAVVGSTRSPSFAAASVPGLPTTLDSNAFLVLLAPADTGYVVTASDGLGDERNDMATDVAFDGPGNLFMSGMLNNDGGGESGDPESGFGFLARYDAAGVRQSLQVWGDEATPDRDAVTSADALAVTPDGRAFVVSNSWSLDRVNGISMQGAELRRWDADGTSASTSPLTSSEYQRGGDIVTDSSGNLYVVLNGENPTVLLFLVGQDSVSTTIPLESGEVRLAVDGNDDVAVLGGGFDSGGYLAKIAGIQTEAKIPPPIAPEPPVHSISYYQQTVDPDRTFLQGCAARVRNEQGVVVLDYGAPRVRGSDSDLEYGTKLVQELDGPDVADFVSTTQIISAVQAFADGYYKVQSCPQYDRTNPDQIDPSMPDFVIAVGVSNATSDPRFGFNHGAAWAEMILQLNIYIDQKNYVGLMVDGAYDAEPDWAGDYNSQELTLDWARGFAAQDVQFEDGRFTSRGLRYFYFGSLDGGPRTAEWMTGGSTHNLDFVYDLAQGIPVAQPLPQIYNAAFAKEWYHLRWYSIERKLRPVVLAGVMTQCATSGCNNDFSGLQAWSWPLYKLDLRNEERRDAAGNVIRPAGTIVSFAPRQGWRAMWDTLHRTLTETTTLSANLRPTDGFVDTSGGMLSKDSVGGCTPNIITYYTPTLRLERDYKEPDNRYAPNNFINPSKEDAEAEPSCIPAGTAFPESSTFSSQFALPVTTTPQFNKKTRQDLPWSTDIAWGTPPPSPLPPPQQ